MKTSIKIVSTICAVVISLSANAQHRNRGNEVQLPQQPQTQTNTNANDRHIWASNNHPWNYGGSTISIHVGGGYPNYYGNNYGYSNHYNVKKAARNSISQSANAIGQALQFSDWNDTYSPWLAKAIRHQQYAKQLYFWGDYTSALNHAERAGFLAWNTLSYFNNGYGQANPYSDPNNPYYRQSNPNTKPQPNNATPDEDYGYRKNSSENSSENNTQRKAENIEASENLKKTELDGTLPQNKVSDRELLKINPKDLNIE